MLENCAKCSLYVLLHYHLKFCCTSTFVGLFFLCCFLHYHMNLCCTSTSTNGITDYRRTLLSFLFIPSTDFYIIEHLNLLNAFFYDWMSISNKCRPYFLPSSFIIFIIHNLLTSQTNHVI